MKTCPICKKQFEAIKGHRNEKKFCSLECYWESKKVESGYQKAICIDCGSGEIFKHGVRQIPKKICSECYKLRWKKLNYDKNFYRKHAKCIVCGKESIAGKDNVKYDQNGNWFCVKCRPVKVRKRKIKIAHCLVCGIVWERSEGETGKILYCSKKCGDSGYSLFFNYWGERRKCTDCGIELTPETRAHKKTGLQCNECNYIRRRLIKDKSIYGVDYLKILGKIRIIDSTRKHFHKNYGGNKSCKTTRLNWLKVIQRLENLFK